MTLQLSLKGLRARLLLLVVTLVVCSLLAFLVASNFISATLTDSRVRVSRDILASAINYFPNSPRLHGRLAKAELSERNRDLSAALLHAETAIRLSPHDYRFRLTLASIKEAQGDRNGAAEALKQALALSPNDVDIHWRLANLLVRQDKLNEALPEFLAATSADNSLLGATLDLVWQTSGGNAEAVERVTGDNPRDRLVLARFLLRQNRAADAASVFGRLDRREKLADYESPAFLNDLIAAGEFDLARSLWAGIQGREENTESLIWNGGFESDIFRDFSQFDWTISRSDYAGIGLDATVARSGARSLRIEFAGRDTTRLSGEIKQLVLLKPGIRYRLEYYVKRSELVTPEGPRIAVVEQKSSKELVASEPLPSGSSDWQRVALEFEASSGPSEATVAAQVLVKRIPRYRYDDPTRGIMWLDDFALTVSKD